MAGASSKVTRKSPVVWLQSVRCPRPPKVLASAITQLAWGPMREKGREMLKLRLGAVLALTSMTLLVACHRGEVRQAEEPSTQVAYDPALGQQTLVHDGLIYQTVGQPLEGDESDLVAVGTAEGFVLYQLPGGGAGTAGRNLLFIRTKDGRKRNGSLLYTIRPIQEVLDLFYARQMARVDEDVAKQRVEAKLAKLAPVSPSEPLCGPLDPETGTDHAGHNSNEIEPLSDEVRRTIGEAG